MKDMTETMMELTFQDAIDSNMKRENANIDANSSMGTMLKYGSENAKEFYLDNLISSDIARAHRDGAIHIHDLDFYALTETCCQIDMSKLFKNGFYSGHGYVRTPQSIQSYAALACIIIQANQNEMHGGQSIPNWEYDLAPGVTKTFLKEMKKRLIDHDGIAYALDRMDYLYRKLENLPENQSIMEYEEKYFYKDDWEAAYTRTEDATFQAMEAVIHNLNMMQSRAGSQVPFSSINLGTGTTLEQRMVIKNFLKALDKGLGHGETSIFPVVIFRVKDGINGKPGDPNYDLFEYACNVSANRMFPNFEFLDAPFNKQFIQGDDPNTFVATMGCRTRVMANVNGESTTCGRGNLSFTTINLPRLGMQANGNIETFYSLLDGMMGLVKKQLLDRYKIQCNRRVKNYPFLMQQGVWRGSEGLNSEDTLETVLKHGTLTIGFIGLAECLIALSGKHHGESEESWKLGYEIIKHMRDFCDQCTEETHLNFSLLGTPAEGSCGKFVRKDKAVFGIRENITDREYYTNSSHIPVWYKCSLKDKIKLEAPFHELCNGGHICYVELDGDVSKNPNGLMNVVQYMKEQGVGYGSVNHTIDFDPVCGYRGIIGDTCPRCGRKEYEGIPEEEVQKWWS